MGGFFTLAFSPDSRVIAGGFVFMVRIWDAATGRELCPVPEHRQGIGFVALSPDGLTAITEGATSPGVPGAGASLEEGPSLRYWQAATGMRLVPTPAQNHRFPPLVDLSTNCKLLAAWDKDKVIGIWDVSTGKRLGQVSYDGELTHCRFSPDGNHLLVGSRDPKKPVLEGDEDLKLWHVPTAKYVGQFRGHPGMLWSVVFSPDSKLLVTIGHHDRTTRLWDVATQRERYQFRNKMPMGALFIGAFSPDGKTLATAGTYGAIQIWDVTTGQELRTLSSPEIKEKHRSGIYALLFTPDGNTLIATDNSGKIFLWDVASGRLRLGWKAHEFRVSRLAQSADGKILVSLGGTTALVWDISALNEGK
jgi:WD40 repeat protein